MPKLIIGAHASIAHGFLAAAEFVVEKLQSNALQIFLKSPRSSGSCKLTAAEARVYREFAMKHELFTVIHSSYLLNFAKDLSADKWLFENLIDDIENCAKLGGAGVVLHVGKSLELSRTEALQWIIKNLATIFTATKKLHVPIFIENLAGQGTELGINFDELAMIYCGLHKPTRMKFCFDSCHAFAAGYDLRTSAKVKKVFAEFDKKLGLSNLACIHFNDSALDFSSHVDRHANLGYGKIGRVGLKAIAKFALKKSIPLILETPQRDGGSHKKDLITLRKWLAND